MNQTFFKASLFVFFISISPALFSQSIGMNSSGATPSSNAVLDLNTGNTSLNQGVIIPHVELGSSLSTFGLVGSASTKDTGMLIYNSNSIRQPVGVYIWNGTTWVGGGSGTSWALTGNSGTTVGTNFVGTTDSMPLQFDVHNRRAGFLDYFANANTFYGRMAGIVNSSGTLNTAIGQQALQNNSSGGINTAVGALAMEANTNGNYNTAVGYAALKSNYNNSNNVAVGFEALSNATGGIARDVALGDNALFSSTANDGNTVTGYEAGYSTTSGNGNVFMGDSAGFANTTGTGNTCVGVHTNMNAGTYTNSTALGNNTSITGANQVNLGNTSVTTIQGQVNYTTYSDRRIKNTIQYNVPGLAFINKLQPVTYHLNIHLQNSMLGITDATSPHDTAYWNHKYDIENIQFTGLIAQQVDSAANQCSYNFSGVTMPTHGNSLYGLKYSEFIAPLIVAVQQLSASTDSISSIIKNYSSGNYINSIGIGNGTEVTANNSTQIGNSAAVFCGINGATYNAADAILVGTSGANGNGACLTVGGVWTNTSDRNKKENFSIPDGEDVLTKVCALPVFRWNYKNEPANVQHIGPMAQDFYRIFRVGNDSLSISTIDPAGIALVAVKELNKKLVAEQELNKKLEEENQSLNAKINQLTKDQDARFSNDEKAIAELKAMMNLNQAQASIKQ